MRRACGALIALAALAGGLFAAYEWGLVRVNYPSYTEFPVRGIDVSRYQGTIDWAAVAASGVSFAFIKATEGGDHRDPRFAENWAGAANANVLRGAYHFFTFCTPGALQAANLIAVVPVEPSALPPAIDVEFAGNCRRWESIETIRRELDVFLGLVERAYGRRPIIYFTRESYERVLDGRLAGYATWARSLFGRPRSRFGAWAFWQYAHNGRVPGIDGLVDLNVFQGSPSALPALRGQGSNGPMSRLEGGHPYSRVTEGNSSKLAYSAPRASGRRLQGFCSASALPCTRPTCRPSRAFVRPLQLRRAARADG